jgi:hypothetical protein
MKAIAAILSLSCCAFGQDKAAISAAEAACGPRDRCRSTNRTIPYQCPRMEKQ